MADIKVPSVGESITEGSIARWLKKEGAQVQTGEPIFELETEKATQEVPAPAAGVLHITVAEGKPVAIGSVVGSIDAAPVGSASPLAASPPPASLPAPPSDKKPQAKPAHDNAPLSPAARRLAKEEGVDVKQLTGSGPGGVVLKSDVQEHVDRGADFQSVKPPAEKASAQQAEKLDQGTVPAASADAKSAPRETRQRMSAIRQRIAERLLAAQKQTASLTTFNEVDMSAIVDLRSRYKETFKEKHDVGLGFMGFFVKAGVQALKAFPVVNARIDGADIVLANYYNIGLAVSTEKGLMVPVLRDADQLTFAQIEKAIAALAAKARDGKINVTDLQGGTFTITNGGIFGSMLSTPILNPPQSAILGMHAIQKRPVVRDDQVVIRPMMYVALTYDHRIVDGRDAVLFLVRVKECLEDPERILLDV